MKCYVCRCELKEDVKDFELPGLHFKFLEGSPFVCERCLAESCGIDASWTDDVENKLKEKTI